MATSKDLTITSSKRIYSQMNLPLKIYVDDVLKVPIKVSNGWTQQDVELWVIVKKNGEEVMRK